MPVFLAGLRPLPGSGLIGMKGKQMACTPGSGFQGRMLECFEKFLYDETGNRFVQPFGSFRQVVCNGLELGEGPGHLRSAEIQFRHGITDLSGT